VAVFSGNSRENEQMTVLLGTVGLRHGKREDQCQYGADDYRPRSGHR
jgi:hypothetical protein